jgi:hypothetical protein
MGPGEPAIPGDPVPLDVAAVTAEFGAALHEAGVPADPGRCARFARAVSVMRPRTLSAHSLDAISDPIAALAQPA